ncbi:MAG: hypothetical protein HQM09_24235 [Candidatus Riflebacteria bacterium]|nr:hypothetical protein [Candidatus Riflebacteria bacterium]
MDLSTLAGKTLEALRKKLLKHADVSLYEKQELERLGPKSSLWSEVILGGVPERVAILNQFANGSLVRVSVKQSDAIRNEYVKIFSAMPHATLLKIEKMVKRIEKIPRAKKAKVVEATSPVTGQAQKQVQASKSAKTIIPVKALEKAKSSKKAPVSVPKHAKPRAKGKGPVQKIPVTSANRIKYQPADRGTGPRIILERCPGELQVRRERGVLVLRIYGTDSVLDKVHIVVRGSD